MVGDRHSDGGWTVRVFYNPLAPWLWAGAVIMVLGGAISLTDRRYRIGVPSGRRSRPAAPAAATTNPT